MVYGRHVFPGFEQRRHSGWQHGGRTQTLINCGQLHLLLSNDAFVNLRSFGTPSTTP
jgi:hypothetical protein